MTIRLAAYAGAVLLAGCAAKPLDFPPVDPAANAAWQAQRAQQQAADDQMRRAALYQMGQNLQNMQLHQPTYQIVQPPAIRTPTTTSCHRFGNMVNCTSY